MDVQMAPQGQGLFWGGTETPSLEQSLGLEHLRMSIQQYVDRGGQPSMDPLDGAVKL